MRLPTFLSITHGDSSEETPEEKAVSFLPDQNEKTNTDISRKDNRIHPRFCVPSAALYARRGMLERWVEEYCRAHRPRISWVLRSGLLWVGPLKVREERLCRIHGPEPEMIFQQPHTLWEERVRWMQMSIVDPLLAPPLIIGRLSDRTSAPFTVLSGAEQFEAFRKLGHQSFWSLIWFENQQGLEEYFKNCRGGESSEH